MLIKRTHDCTGTCNKSVSLALLLAFTLADMAEASGQLHVQFLDYSSGGRTASGNACDPPHPVTGQPDPCDPQFTFTAEREMKGGGELLLYQQAEYYRNQDTVYFTSLFGKWPNPVIIDLNYDDNEGHVWIEISVTDIDEENRTSQLMSQFTAILNATANTAVSRLDMKNSAGQSLSLRYWFSCNPSYYGDLCNKQCIESNDHSNGHAWCDALGNKTCRFGWIDASTDCKKPHPCRTCVCANGGICVPQGDSGGYRCQCQAGYRGANCQKCLLEPSQCGKVSQGTAAGDCDVRPISRVSRSTPSRLTIVELSTVFLLVIGTASLFEQL